MVVPLGSTFSASWGLDGSKSSLPSGGRAGARPSRVASVTVLPSMRLMRAHASLIASQTAREVMVAPVMASTSPPSFVTATVAAGWSLKREMNAGEVSLSPTPRVSRPARAW